MGWGCGELSPPLLVRPFCGRDWLGAAAIIMHHIRWGNSGVGLHFLYYVVIVSMYLCSNENFFLLLACLLGARCACVCLFVCSSCDYAVLDLYLSGHYCDAASFVDTPLTRTLH